MKNSLKSLIVLALGLSLVVSSCKYEEGPSISLRTKKARLANNWKATKVTINNEDVDLDNFNLTLEITKDGDWTQETTTKTFFGEDTEKTKGTWEWGDKKETLKLKDEDGEESTVTIIKLKNKEFWVESEEEDDGEKYTTEIQFEEE